MIIWCQARQITFCWLQWEDVSGGRWTLLSSTFLLTVMTEDAAGATVDKEEWQVIRSESPEGTDRQTTLPSVVCDGLIILEGNHVASGVLSLEVTSESTSVSSPGLSVPQNSKVKDSHDCQLIPHLFCQRGQPTTPSLLYAWGSS